MIFALSTWVGSTGCSSLVADLISGSGTVFSSDEDPELVGHAVPFALKTMEGVLVSEPEHRELLISLSSGFVQYAYAYVDLPAEALAEDDIEASRFQKKRARKLYIRARNYALQGMSAEYENFEERLRNSPDELFEEIKDEDEDEDVPLLYWAAASWALSISSSNLDPHAVADFPLVERLARWAFELNPNWNKGTLHEFFLTFEASRPGGDLDVAEKHFFLALELSKGSRLGPYITLAEKVCVQRQNPKRFFKLLNQALAIDIDKYPANRLVNTIMRRRAIRLKVLAEDLFVEDVDEFLNAGTSSVSLR